MKRALIQEPLIDDRIKCPDCNAPLPPTALGCSACLLRKHEQSTLAVFLADPTAIFKTILRAGKKHAVISAWGRKTLCGYKFNTLDDLGMPRVKADLGVSVTCSECLRIIGR